MFFGEILAQFFNQAVSYFAVIFSTQSCMSSLLTIFFRLEDVLLPPQIWEENGGKSYNPNVAYLARWGRGRR